MDRIEQIAITRAEITTRKRLQRLRWFFSRLGIHLTLGFLGISWLVPFFWLVSTSLKIDSQVMRYPPVWIPQPVDWHNYIEAIQAIPFFLYVRNTLIITVLSCLGSIVSCPLAAYGFSRFQWPGRDLLFIITLGTMMIPYQVTMIPLFLVFNAIKWTNSWLPLIVPSFFGGAFYIFLLRQFFLTIPLELSDAATIDGASEARIFMQILLPLCRPALAVIILFESLSRWTDFLGPLIYLNREDLFTVSIGLQAFVMQRGTTNWALLMAASTLTTLPIVILFIFTQRTFIEGIALTGIKG
jgi:multiple sugar transport system permease protein